MALHSCRIKMVYQAMLPPTSSSLGGYSCCSSAAREEVRPRSTSVPAAPGPRGERGVWGTLQPSDDDGDRKFTESSTERDEDEQGLGRWALCFIGV
jgi:hypothetical protein